MIDDDLFTDSSKVQKITPYRKLRLLRGWTLEQAAEIFTVSRRTLIDIELGRKDAPKWLVRNMDKTYGCNGELIDYWLPRFSVAPIEQPSVWRRLGLWIKTSLLAMTRCMTSAITGRCLSLMRTMKKSTAPMAMKIGQRRTLKNGETD